LIKILGNFIDAFLIIVLSIPEGIFSLITPFFRITINRYFIISISDCLIEEGRSYNKEFACKPDFRWYWCDLLW